MDSALPSVPSWTSAVLDAVCGQRSDLCSTSSIYCTETSRLQHQILEETEPFHSSVALQPVSYQLEEEGQTEQLSVRQVGRKLTEKKQEDGKDSYSARLQEFRQELDLPEGLNPEAVSCSTDPDGKLHIQAAKAPSVEEAEREELRENTQKQQLTAST